MDYTYLQGLIYAIPRGLIREDSIRSLFRCKISYILKNIN